MDDVYKRLSHQPRWVAVCMYAHKLDAPAALTRSQLCAFRNPSGSAALLLWFYWRLHAAGYAVVHVVKAESKAASSDTWTFDARGCMHAVLYARLYAVLIVRMPQLFHCYIASSSRLVGSAFPLFIYLSCSTVRSTYLSCGFSTTKT
jgi:hypothetical protein